MKLRAVAIGATVALAGYLVGLRPWLLSWGTTVGERRDRLPGDDVVPDATLSTTRAVDIATAPEGVWPWLAQLGYGPDRAGFYSYDWLENLIGLDIHSAARISPALQQVRAGDQIPFGPETDFRVEEVAHGTALVLHVRMHPFTGRDVLGGPSRLWIDWTWSFVLRPRAAGTRLLVRTRGAWSHRWVGWLIQPLLEPVHFLMERRMLLGVRKRAEPSASGKPGDCGRRGSA